MEEDRRTRFRGRLLKSGKILLGKAAVPCTVRNLSDAGACLQVQTTVGIPASFGFVMENGEPRSCRVTWRNDNRMGVKFVDAQETERRMDREAV